MAQGPALGNAGRRGEAVSATEGQRPDTAQGRAVRWLTGFLNGLAWALTGWAVIVPWGQEWSSVACAAAPLVAIAVALSSGGAIGLVTTKANPRPHVAHLLVVPLLGLIARATQDVNLVSTTSAIAAAVAGAAVGGGAAFALLPAGRGKPWLAAGVAIMGAVWTYSAYVLADTRLDNSASQTFKTEVVGKKRSHSRATNFSLTLAPWGPRTKEQTIAVDRDFYRSVALGERICVGLHRGALGARWFQIARCSVRSLPLSDQAITPSATAAISRVHTALISGDTPRRTWL
jgi:hypothetical protein